MTENYYAAPTVECEAPKPAVAFSVQFVIVAFWLFGVSFAVFFGFFTLYLVAWLTFGERLFSSTLQMENPLTLVLPASLAIFGVLMVVTARHMTQRIFTAKWGAIVHSLVLMGLGGFYLILLGADMRSLFELVEIAMLAVAFLTLLVGVACFYISVFRYAKAYCIPPDNPLETIA